MLEFIRTLSTDLPSPTLRPFISIKLVWFL